MNKAKKKIKKKTCKPGARISKHIQVIIMVKWRYNRRTNMAREICEKPEYDKFPPIKNSWWTWLTILKEELRYTSSTVVKHSN